MYQMSKRILPKMASMAFLSVFPACVGEKIASSACIARASVGMPVESTSA